MVVLVPLLIIVLLIAGLFWVSRAVMWFPPSQ